jgi:hypothetical protein
MTSKSLACKFIVFFFVLFNCTYFFLALPGKLPEKQVRAAITNASATLSNPRLSFYGVAGGAHIIGDTTIDIDTSGNADNNTNNLFPNDTVTIGSNSNLTVVNVVDSDTFSINQGLGTTAPDQSPVYISQSSILTVSITVGSTIPTNGYLKVTIPDPATNGNNGTPDTNNSTTANGFDFNSLNNTYTSFSGGTNCNWNGTETVTAGDGSTGHIVSQVTSDPCLGGTITVTIGTAAKGLVNPAPVTSGHTQGTADNYKIVVSSHGSDNSIIESSTISVAMLEGILVSATVDNTISFDIDAVAIGTTVCGEPADVLTTVTSVPFGTVTDALNFIDAGHLLTISTNADYGYILYAQENDEMGRDGGISPIIPDYSCAGCSHTTAFNWTSNTTYGLGYSMDDVSGTDAYFEYNDAGTFDAKQFPNEAEATGQYDDSGAQVMSNTGPVTGSSAYVCYRLNISGVQEAGYYYNKIKYTVVPRF